MESAESYPSSPTSEQGPPFAGSEPGPEQWRLLLQAVVKVEAATGTVRAATGTGKASSILFIPTKLVWGEVVKEEDLGRI